MLGKTLTLHSVFDGTNCRYLGFEENFLVFSIIKKDLKGGTFDNIFSNTYFIISFRYQEFRSQSHFHNSFRSFMSYSDKMAYFKLI